MESLASKIKLSLLNLFSILTPFSFLIRFLPKKFIIYGHVVSDNEHAISAHYKYPTFTQFDKFIKQMKSLGYEFCSMEDYIISDARRKILITFDDGFKVIYNELHPYMLLNKLPYSIFIVTDSIGNPEFHFAPLTKKDIDKYGRIFLSEDELKQLILDGVHIGFHTRSHYKITEKSYKDNSTVENQLSVPGEFSHLLSSPLTFAYPFYGPTHYKEIEHPARLNFQYYFDTKGFFPSDENHYFRVSIDGKLGTSNPIRSSVKRQLLFYLIKRFFFHDRVPV